MNFNIKIKILFFILIIFFTGFLFLTKSINALTPTPTPDNVLNEQINDLKNRIASKVAQLKLVEKRGIIATVQEVSDTQITVSNEQGGNSFIDVDELTKFSSPDAKGSFGISDITKGDKIGALGLYNKESRRLLARFINVLDLPEIVYGHVSFVDKNNYTVTITTDINTEEVFDIETVTKTYLYSKTDGLTKSGFSKIEENQRVIGMGQKNKDKKITGDKIFILTEIPKSQTPAKIISP